MDIFFTQKRRPNQSKFKTISCLLLHNFPRLHTPAPPQHLPTPLIPIPPSLAVPLLLLLPPMAPLLPGLRGLAGLPGFPHVPEAAWFNREVLSRKQRPHAGQRNGFSSWIFSCRVRDSRRLKARVHIVQANGFAPECITPCCMRCPFFLNPFPHSGQWKVLSGLGQEDEAAPAEFDGWVS